MRTDNPLEKSLMLGKIEGRRRGRQRMRWLDGITDTMNRHLGKLWEGQGGLACCSPWGQKESDTTGRLNNNSNKTCMLKSQPPAPWDETVFRDGAFSEVIKVK